MVELEIGSRLRDRYLIEARLGSGSSGVTYRAIDEQTRSAVAIKALSLQTIRDWKDVEHFRREAIALAAIQHPRIPRLHAAFDLDDGTSFYIVRELIEGASLQDA